ncbi:MAG: hypothetical protein EAZ78_24325 [Oscillatoriales cyanobacterium]|uniref:hypothetical protein n=1 Tax=Microcoleus anatoxicus TaxID=2705319 RepID=UPI00297AD1DE|nr:MAG: hypothetical protein EA000_09500 [Oscillatoriales cyanobacterium]TAD98737.1 MAG: hypothetical protein EAZ98_05785 [Oscillatoriales cyanobacterium]TAE06990.1 MAG: hypothetical protein EAZ96_00815 [Oscillatoriales cyanobacterium]TAE98270.1 MAG: hypothetical protein EAZ78_24325 [Oscillatoriales cyanobacterium]TAF47417.1 MAG: hypothetical protein EAZ68_01775 [Oscillatoriales cyanobacterium]
MKLIEFKVIKSEIIEDVDKHNLNFKFCSPTHPRMLETAKTNSGLYDLQVNVWDLIYENCPKNNRIKNDEPINCLG